MADGTQVSSDGRGRFVLDGVTIGVAWVAAVGPGCVVATDSVLVVAGREAVLRLRLPVSLADETLGESAVGMSRDELVARGFRSVYEALRAMAPYMVSHLTGEVGGDRYVSNRAGRTFGANAPIVILDGIRLTQVTVAALEDIPIEDLERIEVARSASAAWRYGIGSAGGAIVLTTARSGASPAEFDPTACEVSFPPRS
jgi:outer membrane receptor for ferrienterochelin and colicin